MFAHYMYAWFLLIPQDGLESLPLELQAVVSYHVDVANQTRIC